LAHYGTENILKKLVGRKDVEDALQKLDTLTNEETSMTLATNLKVTHDVDSNVVEIKHSTRRLMPIFAHLSTQISDVPQNSNKRA
jgi:hypothetical protein